MNGADNPFERLAERLRGTSDRADRLIEAVMVAAKGKSKDLTPEQMEVLQSGKMVHARRYRGKELIDMVGGPTPSTISRAQAKGKIPKAGEGRDALGRRTNTGNTLAEINEMRKHFGTQPYRKEHQEAMVMSFLNFKRGTYKTHLTVYFAQWLAVHGYRVLVIDTDPQATASFMLGRRPDVDVGYDQTTGPFMEGTEESPKDLSYAVSETYWPGIDLIPSCMESFFLEAILLGQLIDLTTSEKLGDYMLRLKRGIDTVKDNYDVVLVDGSPSMNSQSWHIVAALDALIIPSPAQMVDFASTKTYLEALADNFELLMGQVLDIEPPIVKAVITKFNAGYADWMANLIRKSFSVDVLENAVLSCPEVAKSATRRGTLYEIDLRGENNRKGIKAALEMFDSVFTEVMQTIVKPFWSSFDEPESEPPRDTFADAMEEQIESALIAGPGKK